MSYVDKMTVGSIIDPSVSHLPRIVLCSKTWDPLFGEQQNNWSVHNVETLREQRT